MDSYAVVVGNLFNNGVLLKYQLDLLKKTNTPLFSLLMDDHYVCSKVD